VLDNIWLGSADVPLFHRRRDLRRRARDALETLGAGDWDLDMPASALSIGQQQLVEVARLLARNARLLILDEPTATLTDTDIARLLDVLKTLKSRGHAILYISHRLGEVFDLCDTVTVLRNGEHIATRQVRDITRDQLIELMLGRPFGEMYPAAAAGPDTGQAFRVEKLNVAGLVQDVSLVAPRGKILCIAGQIGSGANVVTRAVAGLVPAAIGHVSIDGKVLPLGSVPHCVEHHVLFLSEDRAAEGIFHQRSVLENLLAGSFRAHTRFRILDWLQLKRVGAQLAQRVAVDQGRLAAAAGKLSGGNQQKLLFGRAIERPQPGVLLMNEPTRGIDVGARADIYRIMRELCSLGYALIMTSSDLEEVVGIADIVITMYRGRTVARYERQSIAMARILADITHPVRAAA
jgi:ABC-type sugar transport system ATPase subunit